MIGLLIYAVVGLVVGVAAMRVFVLINGDQYGDPETEDMLIGMLFGTLWPMAVPLGLLALAMWALYRKLFR